MSRRASGALIVPLGSDSPVSSWRTGSISTSLQTMLSMSASRFLCSLWHCIMKPPRLLSMAWSTLKTLPHTQIDGLSAISQSYLSFRASRNSPLFRVKPISSIGMTVSQLDAPFSEASSSACCVFRVREFLMSFNFVRSASLFSLRTLCCSELFTTASSGVSWACETIFSTSGA